MTTVIAAGVVNSRRYAPDRFSVSTVRRSSVQVTVNNSTQRAAVLPARRATTRLQAGRSERFPGGGGVQLLSGRRREPLLRLPRGDTSALREVAASPSTQRIGSRSPRPSFAQGSVVYFAPRCGLSVPGWFHPQPGTTDQEYGSVMRIGLTTLRTVGPAGHPHPSTRVRRASTADVIPPV
jgi:hypothetical protein